MITITTVWVLIYVILNLCFVHSYPQFLVTIEREMYYLNQCVMQNLIIMTWKSMWYTAHSALLSMRTIWRSILSWINGDLSLTCAKLKAIKIHSRHVQPRALPLSYGTGGCAADTSLINYWYSITTLCASLRSCQVHYQASTEWPTSAGSARSILIHTGTKRGWIQRKCRSNAVLRWTW